MIFSVWNQRAKAFDYYETPDAGPTHAPTPNHIKGKRIGATPEEAAWPLPASAKSVGSGVVARGRIARKRGLLAMGEIDLHDPIVLAGGLLVAAVLARRYLR